MDMLTPGKSAAAVLQLGDKITAWNGIAMFDAAAGERRLLKEVVTAAVAHSCDRARHTQGTDLGSERRGARHLTTRHADVDDLHLVGVHLGRHG